MRKKRQVIIVFLAASFGLLIGFAISSRSGTGIKSKNAAESASNSLPQGSSQKLVPRKEDDSPLATKLEHDLAMSSGVTKWLSWWQAVEEAQLSDMPRLGRLARGNAIATRLVASRWIELDPRNLFDTLVANQYDRSAFPSELADGLFDEWPTKDRAAVIAALNSPNDSQPCRNWRRRVALGLFRDDVELGIRTLKSWKIEDRTPNLNTIAKWVSANPRHAAEFVLQNPLGSPTGSMMETVATEWAKTDPRAAVEFSSTQPGNDALMGARTALTQWAQTNLGDASEWLAASDSRTQARLSPAFVKAWAAQDASAALAWSQANLTGSALNESVGAVMSGAADKAPTSAAELVLTMTPSRAKAEAAAAVAEKLFPQSSSDKPVTPETLQWLGQLDAESFNRVLKDQWWVWSQGDIKGLAGFLDESRSKAIAPDLAKQVARSFAREDPVKALEWTTRLPQQDILAVGAEAFSEWQGYQSEAAMNWLHKLPEQDPRHDKYFQRALQELAWTPQASDRLAAFSEADRRMAQKFLGNISLSAEQRVRFEEILKIR